MKQKRQYDNFSLICFLTVSAFLLFRVLKGQCNYMDLVNEVSLTPDFG